MLHFFCTNSLALDLGGLGVFQLLGFVNVYEELLQQALSFTQPV